MDGETAKGAQPVEQKAAEGRSYYDSLLKSFEHAVITAARMAAHQRRDQSRVCLYAGAPRKCTSVAAVREWDTKTARYGCPFLVAG
jgi:hypothetical protein